MNLGKILSAMRYTEHENPIDTKVEMLPFYVKEIGFTNDTKFTRGNTNNYADYLLLYSQTRLVFSKYNNKYQINPYDIYISACNTPLTFTQPRGKKGSFIYLVISGKHAQQFYNFVRTNNCIYHTSQHNEIPKLFLSLLNIDFDDASFEDQFEASTLLHQLFFQLYKQSVNVLTAKSMQPPQDTAINQTLSYIEKNYKKDLTIDTLCANVGFSKYYFCKMFKDHMGITVHQYITEFRISKSKYLLSYSKLSITAVASSVGFKNVLTFTRNFEKLVHMTPNEYRQRY
ncbi:MAG: AraC family transcriptional regulator [Eubacteriales bacterium]|nr:AraC family transcriptional regulator [Eubacteriales bacterium]